MVATLSHQSKKKHGRISNTSIASGGVLSSCSIGVLCILVLLLTALEATSQMGAVQNCFDCVIGIWDAETLQATSGQLAPNVPKEIFLGITLANGFVEFGQVEFSIDGLRFEDDGVVLLNVTELVPTAIQLGSLHAPTDTSRTSTEIGGINLIWNSPLRGDQALLKLQIMVFDPVVNHIVRVKRRYPTTNPSYLTAIFNQFDPPYFTPTRVTGGCYVFNPEQSDPCASTSVTQRTWLEVKQLYR